MHRPTLREALPCAIAKNTGTLMARKKTSDFAAAPNIVATLTSRARLASVSNTLLPNKLKSADLNLTG
jgi:hypothetical protein